MKRNLLAIAGVVLVMIVAAAIMVAAPQQAEAKAIKATGGYSFTSPRAAGSGESSATVTPRSKKLIIRGGGYYYKGTTFKTIGRATYTVKLNGKTKYYNASTKTTKKSAFATLRNQNYIAVHLNVKNGVVKRLTFGA